MKSNRALITAVTLAAMLTTQAQADEVTDQLESARKAYESGELRSAVQTLQFAVASIQEKINLSLLKLLPEPLEGWQADEPQAQSAGMAAMIAGTNLTRRYYRDGGAEVELSIMADSPLMSMMTMMLANPMMMQTDPGTRLFTHGGHRGMVKHEKDSERWEINLMVGSKILMQVTGTGVKERATVEDYLKAVDLPAVEQAFSS
ncbi:MAG: hypothetical protein U9Q81_25170 [Pseudomonadota bacterium]|nr:hypothetical protein [Pseudomonadota bacterium]